ncbi:MAG: peptide chain release factor N(5)-glutamine methyltransferase [Pseudobutyrivibrio sp.]|nr:peptide chain release factor N(5)-glutamine methyltransferase [Pseudobutyrivibrio sp.]
MTLKQALDKGILILESNNIADAQIDAWLLLSHVSNVTRADYFIKQNDLVDEAIYAKYIELIDRRANHEPLQHITGEQDFMGLTFKVNEHVLIPRQDTETLVEEALKVIPDDGYILDLCTGSGCVIISLAALSNAVKCVGVDISEMALEVAKKNGSRLVGDRVRFFESDLWSNITEKYDVITSNPPYIRTSDIEELSIEVKDHEPRLALDGTADGLFFYRQIVGRAADYLNLGGWLLVEIGFDQGADVQALFEEAGFKEVQVIKDLAGNNRVVKGHL